MALSFDYTHLMADAVGHQHGLVEEDFDTLVGRSRRIHADLKAKRDADVLGFYNLPQRTDDAAEIKRMATRVRENCDTFVVLGIGGSALGVIATHRALGHAFHNLLPAELRGAPRLFVPDNPDPELTAELLEVIDPKTTIFNVVSKSGSTAETMAHYLVVRDLLKRTVGADKVKDHLVFTTDPAKGVLRKIADAEGIPTLPVPPSVGGRFCVLSAVGLLPAAVMGQDIDAMLAGAATMDKRCSTDNLWENPAHLYSAAHYLLERNRCKSIAVMMPYASALKEMADWFAQLWAESLGKRHDVEGHVVEVGQTPVKTLGATDQHSQVQLYVEGPHDKVTTFLAVEKWREECPIPGDHADEDSLSYLGGSELGQLLNFEQVATEVALTNNHRPNCKITFPQIDEHHVGEFYMMMESATAHSGGLYRINAFDQPGVEEGKVATYALMNRQGFDDKRAALEKSMSSESRRVL